MAVPDARKRARWNRNIEGVPMSDCLKDVGYDDCDCDLCEHELDDEGDDARHR